MGMIRDTLFAALARGVMALVRPGLAINDGGSVPQATLPEGNLHGRYSGGLGLA